MRLEGARMGPERNRRLVLLVLMCVLLLVTSWLEHHLHHLSTSSSSTVKRSSGLAKNAAKKRGRMQEEVGGGGGEGGSEKKAGQEDDEDEEFNEDEDDEFAYFKALKAKSRVLERAPSLHLDLHTCLPRFICELHAQAPGASLTDFEKDVLGLFRNHVVLEGPGSPVYPYQVAAHMGQLCTGLDPSPCHSLYPACPLSRTLLIEVLRSVKSSRRMFY